jgi:hypothetical protein
MQQKAGFTLFALGTLAGTIVGAALLNMNAAGFNHEPYVVLPDPVALSGQVTVYEETRYGMLSLTRPRCPAPSEFMVQGIQASVDEDDGARRVIRAPDVWANWSAFVSTEQRYVGRGAGPVGLRAIGHGVDDVTAEVPPGLATPAGSTLTVYVEILGENTAPSAVQFEVHVWGKCGIPFVAVAK